MSSLYMIDTSEAKNEAEASRLICCEGIEKTFWKRANQFFSRECLLHRSPSGLAMDETIHGDGSVLGRKMGYVSE